MRKEIQPEKLRTMVRSILPSKARHWARRKKQGRKRVHRHEVRVDLKNHEETARDLLRDVTMHDVVFWRRAADKLAHFIRWCHKLTRGMPVQRKLAYIRAVLPRNVIGDHAYSHWESECRYGRFSILAWKEEQRRKAQSVYDSARHHLCRAMSDDPEVITRLNAEIKSRKQPDEPRRLLLGIHDVDSFVAAIVNDEKYEIEREALHREINPRQSPSRKLTS